MKGHIGDVHAHVPDLLQQLLGKMQSRSGRRRRAGDPGIDRLIPFAVLQLLLDIGRQRHFAQPLQNLQKDALIVELYELFALLQILGDGGGQFSISEGNLGAGL